MASCAIVPLHMTGSERDQPAISPFLSAALLSIKRVE